LGDLKIAFAQAKPIPVLPPVITTVREPVSPFPENRWSINYLFCEDELAVAIS
jgi:hypothetical protein